MTTHIHWLVRLTLCIELYAAALWLAEAPWTVEDWSSFSDVGLAGVGFGCSNYNTHTVQREKKMKEAVSILIRLWGIFIREQDKYNSVQTHKKSIGSFVKGLGFEHQSCKATIILLCWRRKQMKSVGKPLWNSSMLSYNQNEILPCYINSLILVSFRIWLRLTYNKGQQTTYDFWGNGP